MLNTKIIIQHKLIVLFTIFTCNVQAQITSITGQSGYYENLICIDKNKSYKDKHLIIQDIAKKVEYIKLETNDNCLIGKEFNVEFIRATANDIFIIEVEAIYRFSRKDGKFLNRIGKRGEGPNEYVTSASFAVNENRQEVLVHDLNKKKLFIYKYNGTFVRDINMPQISLLNLVDDNMLACYIEDTQSDIPAFGLFSLLGGKMIKNLSPPYTSRSGTSYRLPPQYTSTRHNKGNVFFNTYVTDTIFAVNKKGRTPRYALLPPNNGKTTKDKESCSTPYLLCETDVFANIHVYGSQGNSSYDSYIIDKKTGTIYKGFVVDAEFSRAILPYNTGMDNEITTLHYVYLLKEKAKQRKLYGKLKEVALTMNEEDNPILMIATF